MSQNFAVIVLAAGASAQRQKPKQLLPYLGKTLIEHAARTALASGAQEVIIVAGEDAPTLREKLRRLPVRVIFNRDWAEGIASSIRCGINAVRSEVGCAVISLCDQPRTTPALLQELAQRHFATGAPIVASSYDGVVGAPSAFGSDVFSTLISLQGNTGAREIIRRSAVPVETVEFRDGNVDVDVPEAIHWVLLAGIAEAPRDMYRDPKEARGPPQATNTSSFSA
jgi:molybdenum cofactor cytidylyltransferase